MTDDNRPQDPTPAPDPPSGDPVTPQPPAGPGAPPSEGAAGDITPRAGDIVGEPVATASSPRKTGPLTLVLGLVVLAAIGAGAIIAVKSAGQDVALAERVPADVALFANVSLNPSGDQKDAVRDLLGRLPADRRAKVTESIDDLLDSAVEPLGMTWRTDFKPWVGDDAGVVLFEGAAGRKPSIVLMASVKDEARARSALTRARANADPEQRFAFTIEDGVAYVAPPELAISDFRARAERAPLSGNEGYTSRLERLGGEGLAFFWANGSKLASLLQQGSVTPFGGLATFGSATGDSAAVLRVEDEGFLVRAHQRQMPGFELGSGRPALVESTSAGNLASMTMFDLGGIFQQMLQAFAGVPSGEGSPEAMIRSIEGFLGLDVERDLLPWLQGEFSVLFGGVARGSAFPFNVGALIAPTDQAAATRTLRALSRTMARIGPVQTRRGGFDARLGSVPIVVRQARDRVVVATNAAYANQLMRPSGSTLASDAVYRRVLGGTADKVTQQLFIRVDRVRQLVEASMSGESLASYEREVKPVVSLFDAIGLRATLSGGDIDFRMLISVAPQS